jgi:catechol-2,3-dioxygenase
MSITRLGHIGLVVPDVDRYAAFLVDGLGLREVAREPDHLLLGLNSRHHQVRLSEGPYGCDGIGFDVTDAAGLAALRERIESAGLAITRDTPVHPSIAEGFSFAVPGGPSVELCVGAATAPDLAGDPLDHYRVKHGRTTKLRKLGHVSVGSPDPASVQRLFVEVLGFRVSDRFGDVLTWARCNSDHHTVGFAPAAAPGAQHVAYELESFAHYEELADRLAQRGTRLLWGPGRHGPGNNLFVYFLDPEGGMIEVYSDMVRIENDADYVAHEWDDLQMVGNSWGPLPDPAWATMLTPFVPA